jgi:hypothetical protein
VKHLYKKDFKSGMIRYLCDEALREKHHYQVTSIVLKCDCKPCAKVKGKQLLAEGKREELDELFIRFRMSMGDLRV